MTRPKPLFRQRRPAQCRLESVESVAFRRLMYAENAAEVRREHEHGRESFRIISSAGFDPWALDMDALMACSRLEGTVDVAGEVLLMIVPSDLRMDHMTLDRAICEAGVTRFVRRTMPSDRPFPDVSIGEFVLVQELSKGLRHRVPIAIE
jgi:hypothetical protein